MTTTTRDGRPVTAAKIYIDQLSDGTCFTSEQQGEFGPYVLWEDHQAEVKRLTNERDEAQAEVERLTAENARLTNEHTLARDTIDRLSIERDFTQREGELLKTDVERLTNERDEAHAHLKHLIDERNHSASLNGSRPSDEDIWREAFFARVPYYVDAMKERYCTRAQTADLALAEYRKRWPR